MKIRPFGAELFHEDGQTDMAKLIFAFGAHTDCYLYVLYVSQNRLQLFPYTVFTDWIL